MRKFHPFEFIVVDYKELIKGLASNYYIHTDEGESFPLPMEYLSYTHNMSDISKEELFSKENDYRILLSFEHPGYFLHEDCFSYRNGNKFQIGDMYYDGKEFFGFGFIKENGVNAGIKGFGFINLISKREESFNEFFLKRKRNKKNKLRFLGNMYLQTLKVAKLQVKYYMGLSNPEKLTKLSSIKRIDSNITFAYNRLSRFNMYIIRENNDNIVIKNSKEIHIKDAYDAETNVWNLDLHVHKDNLTYVIESNGLSYSPSLRTTTGTIFKYEIDDSVLNRIKSSNNLTFPKVFEKIKKEQNLFNMQRNVVAYLETDGQVYLYSLDTLGRLSFESTELYFHYNSMVFKSIDVSLTDDAYISEYLKMI